MENGVIVFKGLGIIILDDGINNKNTIITMVVSIC